MAWGGISWGKKSKLIILAKNKRTSKDFIEQAVYDGYLEEFLGELDNPVLMEDGAPIHRAKTAQNWREKHEVDKLVWPPQSPDLNPIENLWKIMKDEVQRRLVELFVWLEIRPFCVCPLRRSFVPGYVTMDTKIVKTKIFVETVRQGENLRHHFEWGRFVDFRLPIFRGQGQGARRVHFGNMIQTDGVGVSVLKRGQWHNEFNPRQAENQGQEAREFPYITDPEANLPQDNCVVIDPGRRDLLYCMHENSTVENPNIHNFKIKV